ncbi:Hypothetical predicted protein [Prunus dulcis]|uniref:Uncharacterized protein n=1 Tax=Prunus dulcis TaxID=3755 RepID=A0A5E4F1P4_PRUDU|nr:Hypothetical predicted protein [Prunus dulcis]
MFEKILGKGLCVRTVRAHGCARFDQRELVPFGKKEPSLCALPLVSSEFGKEAIADSARHWVLKEEGSGLLECSQKEEACESWVSWQGVIIMRGPWWSRSLVVWEGVYRRGLEAVLSFQQIVIRQVIWGLWQLLVKLSRSR